MIGLIFMKIIIILIIIITLTIITIKFNLEIQKMIPWPTQNRLTTIIMIIYICDLIIKKLKMMRIAITTQKVWGIQMYGHFLAKTKIRQTNTKKGLNRELWTCQNLKRLLKWTTFLGPIQYKIILQIIRDKKWTTWLKYEKMKALRQISLYRFQLVKASIGVTISVPRSWAIKSIDHKINREPIYKHTIQLENHWARLRDCMHNFTIQIWQAKVPPIVTNSTIWLNNYLMLIWLTILESEDNCNLQPKD